MTGWRVTTAHVSDGQFWLGVADKPELIGITILPCPETTHPLQRAQACADALNHYDKEREIPQGDGRWMHRSDRPSWHPDDCEWACCWARTKA